MTDELKPPTNSQNYNSQQEQAEGIREQNVGRVVDPKEKLSDTSDENQANLAQAHCQGMGLNEHPFQDKINKLCKGLPVDQIPNVINNPEAAAKAHQLQQQKQQRLRLQQDQQPQR